MATSSCRTNRGMFRHIAKEETTGDFLGYYGTTRQRETKHATQCCLDKCRGPSRSCHGPSVGVPVAHAPRANLRNVDLDGLGMCYLLFLGSHSFCNIVGIYGCEGGISRCKGGMVGGNWHSRSYHPGKALKYYYFCYDMSLTISSHFM